MAGIRPPRLAPRNGCRTAAGVVRWITAGQVIGTVQAAHHRLEATMVTEVTIVLEENLDGGRAVEPVRFGIGGTDHEIDMNSENARAFRRQLASYIEHARRTGGRQWYRRARTAARHAARTSEPGPKTKASRSATVAASRSRACFGLPAVGNGWRYGPEVPSGRAFENTTTALPAAAARPVLQTATAVTRSSK